MLKQIIRHTLATIVLLTAGAVSAADDIRLALSGLHLAADKVRGGGDWWGLYPDGEGYTLRPTRVRVEAVVNPLADGDTRKTATQITIPEKTDDIVLIQSMMSAVAGPVVSLKPSKNWGYVEPGDSFVLPWDGASDDEVLIVTAEGNQEVREATGSQWTEVVDYKLLLSRQSGEATIRQVLVSISEPKDEDGPALLWAGDLDRDGKLDLLYNLRTFYTRTELALFLSSAAKEGELVGLVARWNAVGGC